MEKYIKLPSTEVEIENNCREYVACGFPTTLGSVDCVHIRLWNCSDNFKILASGRLKHPTRSYQVIVNHRKDILSVTRGYCGTTSDKTIAKMDPSLTEIRNGKYGEVKTYIYSGNGDETVCMKDLNLICDNGYHAWVRFLSWN